MNQLRDSNDPLCFFASRIAFFYVLMAPFVASNVFAQENSHWYASSCLLPQKISPPWNLFDSVADSDPVQSDGILTLASDGFVADSMFYSQSSSVVDTLGPFFIEARLRYVSGFTTNAARSHIGIFVTTDQNTGNSFQIDKDSVFFNVGTLIPGKKISVDTDDEFHTYRIEYNGKGQFRVLYDGNEILTESAYFSPSDHGPNQRIGWGDGTILASGISEWKYFRHNAVTTIPKSTLFLSSSGNGQTAIINGNLTQQIESVNSQPPSIGFEQVNRHSDLHALARFDCSAGAGQVSTTSVDLSMDRLNELLDEVIFDLRNDQLTSAQEFFIFAEKERVRLESDLSVNWLAALDESGVMYGSEVLPTGGMIPSGTFVSSSILHFDTLEGQVADLTGSATFESPIIGVALSSDNLNSSDHLLGVDGVDYPSSDGRAWEIEGQNGSFIISGDRKTITVEGLVDELLDQMRIITAAAPQDVLDEPYVAADDFIEGADEVTLDNCSSAWYRITFDLPSNFAKPTINGIANVDDVAVAWLNGSRISAEVAITDLGIDRVDAQGLTLLSWPTLDPFSSCDPSHFVVGTNELVFGVVGDLSKFDPTGVEFECTVSFDTILLGDVNLDGSIDLLDVAPFVELITSGDFQAEADINQDGVVNLLDVGPFVGLLSGG